MNNVKRGLGSLFFMRKNEGVLLLGSYMRLIQVTLLALLVVLQYRYWFAENGYFDNQRLQEEIETVQAELAIQKQKNDNLEARVDDLKSGNDAIEELARQNLGLIKPGESFIMMTDEN